MQHFYSFNNCIKGIIECIYVCECIHVCVCAYVCTKLMTAELNMIVYETSSTLKTYN